jgi:hypothetical protein
VKEDDMKSKIIKLSSMLIFLFIVACVTTPAPEKHCDPADCIKPVCPEKQKRDKAAELKAMIEKDGYSVIPPTATQSIRKRAETSQDDLELYRLVTVEGWHYLTSTMRQGTQTLEINLPNLIPDINLKEVKVGLGMPLVSKFKVTERSIQCVYFSIGKPLYLKTALMAIRIYGNLCGLFEPTYIVATKRLPGEGVEFWWKYEAGIPVYITPEEGHKALERYIQTELGRWKGA